jgi:hypothetical protein
MANNDDDCGRNRLNRDAEAGNRISRPDDTEDIVYGDPNRDPSGKGVTKY